ncbi:hypothetical protein [Burkholderia vietnamiensis]|jgi:hypothetical protein|uniref:hypothetical protein n=1 Tax=Burkholderia vietnamiensis TaxID=60552 RepID=UPI0010412153|nr:hypothetical protein [Burkholderia vietnamiensis]MDN8071343.1 hypothetical protein [Burkholderia vietnamiensis]HEF4840682.1 hypothetical protein [Burkholderia vietnamiensis]
MLQYVAATFPVEFIVNSISNVFSYFHLMGGHMTYLREIASLVEGVVHNGKEVCFTLIAHHCLTAEQVSAPAS